MSQPTSISFRALCAELADRLDDALTYTVQSDTERSMRQLITRTRAELAKTEPEGQGPTIVISEPYKTIIPEELPPRLMQIAAATVAKSVPDAYRLARFEDGNGVTNLKLQGYFTWFQGGIPGKYCGEWRDIETVDWLHARDDEPYGSLKGMH